MGETQRCLQPPPFSDPAVCTRVLPALCMHAGSDRGVTPTRRRAAFGSAPVRGAGGLLGVWPTPTPCASGSFTSKHKASAGVVLSDVFPLEAKPTRSVRRRRAAPHRARCAPSRSRGTSPCRCAPPVVPARSKPSCRWLGNVGSSLREASRRLATCRCCRRSIPPPPRPGLLCFALR